MGPMMLWGVLVILAALTGYLALQVRQMRLQADWTAEYVQDIRARLGTLEHFRDEFVRRRQQIGLLKESPGRERLRQRLMDRAKEPV